MKLLPSRRVLCTQYNHAPCHFMQSYIRKVYACLAVTCHLHFWQNDRGLLRATAVTRGGTDTEIRVSTESRPWRIKFSRRSYKDSNTRPFDHESGTLTTELSPPPWNDLPLTLRRKHSLGSFKCNLKEFLFQNCRPVMFCSVLLFSSISSL